jgi:allantoinase
MAVDLIVRSRRVVTASGESPASIHIRRGRIERIAAHDDCPPGVQLDDAGSLVVMPGVVDTHVHLNEPGRTEWEGFETGTAAAAAGGITTIIDMPLNSVPATIDVAALEAKRRAAAGRVHVDVAFWGGIVPRNAASVDDLVNAGVAGFKAFMVPSGVDEFPAVTEQDLRDALGVVAARDVPLLVHAESSPAIEASAHVLGAGDPTQYSTWLTSRPTRAEVEAIELLVRLSREFGAHVHVVHLATATALPALRAAKKEGVRITVETCPHYLSFAAEEISDRATTFKCAPPIRDAANRDALWRAVLDREIDLIATDHSPCPPEMKCLRSGSFTSAWGGIASLELALAAVWTAGSERGLSLPDVSRLLSRGPAELAGLQQRKGTLARGYDADLTIWNPDEMTTVDASRLVQRHKLTPYDGRTLRGTVQRTYVRGQLVYSRGEDALRKPAVGTLLDCRAL